MSDTAAVIGLGKLGAPLAACLAAKGLRVIGVDLDGDKVSAVNQGTAPVFEPGLAEMIASARGRLSATDDLAAAVRSADVTFIVVPTPSEATGEFSLRQVLAACESIGRALVQKTGFPSVALTSTVMPGSTAGPVRSALERASGKRSGRDFALCYAPEFVALGTVLRDLLHPDCVLIGEAEPRSGDVLASLYARLCENDPPIVRMNCTDAELTKLAANAFLTTKISFANMLARICERLPGAHVDTVTAALGLDSRIGPKCLTGSVSYGGPCFPRDTVALAALARQLGAPPHIATATHEINRWQAAWLADLVERHVPRNGRVGVLGLTYKPDTDLVEHSVGFLLAQALAARAVPVVAFDPAGHRNAAAVLGDSVEFAPSAEACIRDSDVVVLATAWPVFRTIPAEQWTRQPAPRVVIDCWRVLDRLQNCAGVSYVPLGTGLLEPARSDNPRPAADGGAFAARK